MAICRLIPRTARPPAQAGAAYGGVYSSFSTVSATGVFLPSFTSDGAVVAASSVLSASGIVADELNMAGDVLSGSAIVAGTGTYTAAPISGDAAVAVSNSTISGEGLFIPAGIAGEGAVASATSIVSGSGTAALPERTGTGTVASAGSSVAASGTFEAPAQTVVYHVLSDDTNWLDEASGNPVTKEGLDAEGAVTTGASIVSASGTMNFDRYANGAVEASAVSVSASGTRSVPERIGNGAVASASSSVAGSGDYVGTQTFYLRNTQNNTGSGGSIYDLSTTQGSGTTAAVSCVAGSSLTDAGSWQLTVDDGISDTSFPISVVVTSIDASTAYAFRIDRRNSSGVTQASSAFSSESTSAGTFTETLTLSTTWNVGDQLHLVAAMRKTGGSGERFLTVDTEHVNSYVQATG